MLNLGHVCKGILTKVMILPFFVNRGICGGGDILDRPYIRINTIL